MEKVFDSKRVPLDDSILNDVAGGLNKSNMYTPDASYLYWDQKYGDNPFMADELYTCSDTQLYKDYISGEGKNKTDAERIDYLVNVAGIFHRYK